MSLIEIHTEEKRPRFYTPAEVSLHSTPDDLWVSMRGRVYDLSALVQRCRADPGVKPLIARAGKDISHWFNPATGDLKQHVDPSSYVLSLYQPHGSLLGVPPADPSSRWVAAAGVPWWKDEARYCIGRLAARVRRLRVLDLLTRSEQTLQVPEEETLSQILQRVLHYNAHAANYVWKHLGRVLDMQKTLTENQIADERDDFKDTDLDEDSYLPAIELYFADDLTEL